VAARRDSRRRANISPRKTGEVLRGELFAGRSSEALSSVSVWASAGAGTKKEVGIAVVLFPVGKSVYLRTSDTVPRLEPVCNAREQFVFLGVVRDAEEGGWEAIRERRADWDPANRVRVSRPLPKRLRTIQSEERADVAQLVEQLIRNQQVIGSSPIVGSTLPFPPYLSKRIAVIQVALRPPGSWNGLCPGCIAATVPLMRRGGNFHSGGCSTSGCTKSDTSYPRTFCCRVNSGLLIHSYSWHNRSKKSGSSVVVPLRRKERDRKRRARVSSRSTSGAAGVLVDYRRVGTRCGGPGRDQPREP
jgi:hypothetical protein